MNKKPINKTLNVDKSKNIIINEQKINRPLSIVYEGFNKKDTIENNNSKKVINISDSEIIQNQPIKISNIKKYNAKFKNKINKKKKKERNIITQNIKTRNGMNFSVKNKKKLEKTKKIMAYNDAELNNLSYKLARKYDKRNYCKYYFSLLRTKHIILFTFFNNTDYNIKIIKIDLFLFGFILYFVVNALFLIMIQCIKYIKTKETIILYTSCHKLYILFLYQLYLMPF